MAYLSPAELVRLAGVRPAMLAHVLPIENEVEARTGKKIYVAPDGGGRSYDTQVRIYADSGNGTKYAAAPPGRSRHELGGAVDFNIVNGTDDDYRALRDVAVARGLVAGYDFHPTDSYPNAKKDPYHIELNETRAEAEAAFADYQKKKPSCSSCSALLYFSGTHR